MKLRVAVLSLLSASPGAEAQPQGPVPAPAKLAQAVRVPNHSLQLDGRPDEALWASIPAITDFVQKEPIFGAPPSEGMELRFAYDDNALWVGARMEVKGREIQAPLTRRDETSRSEHLWISLDTYHDKRTAYSYGVSAAGVRMDFSHQGDSEGDIDSEYDPVWEAKAHRDEAGWTAELRIPFSQLRFNAGDTQVWGLNVDRWIPSKNEDVFWIPIPKDETGWSSRMGELHGISGVKPTRRIELLPYVAATGVSGEADGTPLRDGWDQRGRAGLDFKMGLGPNLTLESTILPDFGQVEADPADIERLQRSSARYFQRPDATHVRLDPARRSLAGGSGRLSLSKEEGHWTFDLSTNFVSPENERNDIGSLQTSDRVSLSADVAYRQTTPGLFHRFQVEVSGNADKNYAGELQSQRASAEGVFTWRNYWNTSLIGSLQRTLVPKQRGPEVGVSAGQHSLCGLATGSRGFRGIRPCRFSRPRRLPLGTGRQHLRHQDQFLLGREVGNPTVCWPVGYEQEPCRTTVTWAPRAAHALP